MHRVGRGRGGEEGGGEGGEEGGGQERKEIRGGAITDVYIHSYAEGACLDLLIITVPYNEPQPTMGNLREPHIDEIKIGFY